MAPYESPARSNWFPPIWRPAGASPFDDIASSCPVEAASIPVPKARGPDVAVAVRYSLNARRRRWGVGYDEGAGRREPCAGNSIRSQEQRCEENSEHHFHSLDPCQQAGVKIALIPVQ
jgi:hypothetical protein